MRIGVLLPLNRQTEEEFRKLKDIGLDSCQLCGWDMSLFTPEKADEVKTLAQKMDIHISTFWCGWSGPKVWNAIDGPLTLGLVPAEYRMRRLEELKLGADFAVWLGVAQMATHVGFIPESPSDPLYGGLIAVLRDLARHCKKQNLHFLFETGQETPMTLLRTMEDIGTDNLGVNLDPANLIMYGKANPVDALPMLGKWVRDIHAKDGCYPTGGRELGHEKPLGQGQVDIAALMAGLKKTGYDGSVTIEREISGEEQIKDIRAAIVLLREMI